MIRILVPMGEELVTDDNEIVNSFYHELELEHSLISLSKWEAKFNKSFLDEEDKTDEEALWYMRAMDLSSRTPPEVYANLTKENVEAAFGYVNAKQTATTFHNHDNGKPSGARRERITAEIIYHWMIEHQIPVEWGEKQHLDKLFALIQVRNLKSQPAKKMNKQEALRQRRALNDQRRKKYNTGG